MSLSALRELFEYYPDLGELEIGNATDAQVLWACRQVIRDFDF